MEAAIEFYASVLCGNAMHFCRRCTRMHANAPEGAQSSWAVRWISGRGLAKNRHKRRSLAFRWMHRAVSAGASVLPAFDDDRFLNHQISDVFPDDKAVILDSDALPLCD